MEAIRGVNSKTFSSSIEVASVFAVVCIASIMVVLVPSEVFSAPPSNGAASDKDLLPVPQTVPDKITNKEGVSPEGFQAIYNHFRGTKGRPGGRPIHGTDDEFTDFVNKMDQLNEIAQAQNGIKCQGKCPGYMKRMDDEYQAKGMISQSPLFEGDMELSSAQLDEIIASAKEVSANPPNKGGKAVFPSEQGQKPAIAQPGWEGAGNQQRAKRTLTSNLAQRWTMPIRYNLDPNVNATVVQLAISQWTSNTCLQFTKDTTITSSSSPGPGMWMQPSSDPNTCGSSAIGMNQNGAINVVNIACGWGASAHEIGHAMGNYHEQSRYDARSYTTVNSTNVMPAYAGNFAVYSAASESVYGVSYDMGSDMHYLQASFQIDPSYPTIYANDPNYRESISQMSALTFADVKYMNQAYCNGTCQGVTLSSPCRFCGYQDPKNCAQCRCPEGFTGSDCGYIQGMSTMCGGIVYQAKPGVAQTIVMNGTVPYDKCYYYIYSSDYSSPVQIQVTKLDYGYGTAPTSFHGCPYYSNTQKSYVEIRSGDFCAVGARFCWKSDAVNTYTSVGWQAMVTYSSGDASFPGNMVLTYWQ